jgi:hypothetical protein
MMTTGLVLDLSLPTSAKMSRELVKNTDALAALRTFMAQKARWCIISGELHKNGGGVFTARILHEGHVTEAFLLANARLREEGSRSTVWLFNVEPALAAVLQAEVALHSATVGGVQ